MNEQKIIDQAFLALTHAYAPYSHFQVGACVYTKDDQYILGANIENASYGLTNCGERSALFTAYSMGYRKDDIVAIAIVTDSDTITSPCGACRQVLVELVNEDTPIILSNKKQTIRTTIKALLPMSFTNKSL